ncbi:MAG: hypothetical protein JKX95_01900 [Bacteroidia bacterium]|nr:hypothetical protein [Bacteroidia bacterium]
MKDFRKFVFPCILVFLFYSCKKDPSTINLHYDYFPLKTGNWIIYNVDSIVYDDFEETIDTFSYQLKERVDSTFIDLEGDTAYVLYLFKRTADTLSWNIYKTWTAKLTSSTAEKVEDNLRFIKLAFPLSESNSWEGNSFFNSSGDDLECYGDWDFEYSNIHKRIDSLKKSFDSTVTILQVDDKPLTNKDYSIEIYAKDVGMVYKKHICLEKGGDISPSAPYIKGFIYKMTVDTFSN